MGREHDGLKDGAAIIVEQPGAGQTQPSRQLLLQMRMQDTKAPAASNPRPWNRFAG